MKTMTTIMFAIGAAYAGPAICADKDDAFLKEMSRTDGNANGEYFKPEQPVKPAKFTDADKAFLVEMQRTDGYVAERPAVVPAKNEQPSEVAQR